MKKSTKTIILIVILLAIGVFYFTKNFTGNAILSGMAIREFSLFQKIDSFSLQTKIFLLQWIVVILVATLILIRYFKKRMKDTKQVQEKRVCSHNEGGKTHTDLDELYKMLIANKKIKISGIVKEFNISKEKALEWGKIFEDEGIVEINYPAFLEPEIRLKIDEKEYSKEREKCGLKEGEDKEDKKDQLNEQNKEENSKKQEENKEDKLEVKKGLKEEKSSNELNKEEKKDDKEHKKQKKENNKEKKQKNK